MGNTSVDVDFLIIGSGVAGLTYARIVAKYGSTLILTKKNRAESNSNYAQGGIAGVMSDEDDTRLHFMDTLTAGAGICHEDAVDLLVKEGPDRIRELVSLGARFSTFTDEDGQEHLALGREGGHSRNRIVHAVDRTGYECERALLLSMKNLPNIEFYENYYVVNLLISRRNGEDRCVGVCALNTETGQLETFRAKAVLLATGGCGRIYQHTTNPAVATGDGVSMAWRAGAAISNMEFIQFHPTCLYHPRGESFLISEAVRGEGGILRAMDGAEFMDKYHPLGALAPRDIVARAIHAERTRRGDACVQLDVTHLNKEYVRRRFPTIFKHCLELGININRQPIPVVPAAHYMCGGVRTDLNGQTSIPGLFAAGEVACTGVHGANRLASNSLLEAMVYGHRAAEFAKNSPEVKTGVLSDTPCAEHAEGPVAMEDVYTLRLRIQSTMNDLVGILRNDNELLLAEDKIGQIRSIARHMMQESLPHPDLYELVNMCDVSLLVIRSALHRKESRGLHFTTDYPGTDDIRWKHDTVIINDSIQ